jgi:hypothetical protein
MTDPRADGRPEVWLRGNVRPAGAAAAIAAAVGGLAVVAMIAARSPGWLVATVAAAVGLALGAGGTAVWIASRPRLARRGDALEVRLAPLSVERIPLAVVECIFRGSEPLASPGDEPARFRVGTLIVRLAERATAWGSRPTFRPWGTWADGHVVIDGRWCEPLSPEAVRGVAARLLEAKREQAAGNWP